MTYTPKTWIRLGFGAALLGTASLAACGGEGENNEHGEAGEGQAVIAGEAGEVGESGEGEGGEGESGAALDPALLLPVNQRAALLSGHLATATALARVGAAEDAAIQLRNALADFEAGELGRLEAAGFDPAPIAAAQEALESGGDATEFLSAADANLVTLRADAGGDVPDLVRFLMKRCLSSYREGVSLENQITDAVGFQTAYGYAVTARELAASLDREDAKGAQLELELLVRMWPDTGPLAEAAPAPVMNFASQISRVELELSTL